MSNSSTEDVLEKKSIAFQAEGRLLQELGLRLVASPEVALVELIKNAFDADSASCTVTVDSNEEVLTVRDYGHGMTVNDFKLKWMRIATSSKTKQDTSPKYKRRLTGAKGIGRFAVRYLGDHLTLETIAFDKSFGFNTHLRAEFDWEKLDVETDISKSVVEYTLTKAPVHSKTGTTLTVRDLRSTTDFSQSSELRTKVLRIVTPLQGLDPGQFGEKRRSGSNDPGFIVTLPGGTESANVNLAKLVLDNYWARLTIRLDGNLLRYEYHLHGAVESKVLTLQRSNNLSQGVFADIRFFPRRAGVFRAKGIDGKAAWAWVRENCGVKVVDHGFHIHPYGFDDDDWLWLDRDNAHNERNWRTSIAKKRFPLSRAQEKHPGENPVLNLASNYQLVGAVFVRTKRRPGKKDEPDLIPAMDREGFLENEGYDQLRDFIRAGLEYLAYEDKAELKRREAARAEESARTARKDIKDAIKHIQAISTLSAGDKSRLVKQYRYLADRVDEQEEYSASARRSLLTMGLLGVVAGFMTHESKAMMFELDQAVAYLRTLAKKDKRLRDAAVELSSRTKNFRGYLEYARLFVRNVRQTEHQPLSASGQVRHILERFRAFADERGIAVTNEIARTLKTPALPVTVYSGILLNLYTNALKAVVAAETSTKHPKITFRGWNEGDKHVVEVADNGVGIPPQLRKRIWEPLYTTTSDMGNPLGSGMGLGLALVKDIISEVGGTISLLKRAPPGFNTCFRVVFRKK